MFVIRLCVCACFFMFSFFVLTFVSVALSAEVFDALDADYHMIKKYKNKVVASNKIYSITVDPCSSTTQSTTTTRTTTTTNPTTKPTTTTTTTTTNPTTTTTTTCYPIIPGGRSSSLATIVNPNMALRWIISKSSRNANLRGVFPPDYCNQVCLFSTLCAFSPTRSFCMPATKRCFGLFVEDSATIHYQPQSPVCFEPRVQAVICG